MKYLNRIGFVTFCLLSLSTSIASAQAQRIKQEESSPSPSPTSINLFPGWVIAANAKSTVIASSAATTARWYAIARSKGAPANTVTLNVDGRTSPFPVHPGGATLVYGTKLSATHVPGSEPSYGSWDLVPADKLLSIATVWLVNPDGGPQALVAMLDNKREFVLELATPDPTTTNPPTKTCRNGRMIVFVDGNPLDGGRTFEQGSSVIAYGKEVGVSVSGDCDPTASFYGRIRLIN